MDHIAPWYKQFWPWFIIFIPAATVFFCINLLFIALDTQDSVVIDDYYKEGKAINMKLSKIEEAKNRNISLSVKTQNNEMLLQFVSGKPEQTIPLKASFYHPTLKDKDFDVNFTANASGDYLAALPDQISGKWRLTILPFDESWKIQQTIALPAASGILIEP